MCGLGRNYRLQDIQLSKSPTSAGYRRRRPGQPVVRPPSPVGLRRTPFASSGGQRRVVENTGLEPVTSWLQTRRSPS
jgi:hypothetical protein